MGADHQGKRHEQRQRLSERLHREGRPDLASVLEKCAQELVIECLCCGVRILAEKGCKRRWCPVCAPRVTAARYERLRGIVQRFRWPLAVTLTRRNVLEAEKAISEFKEAFRKFRRTGFWSATVRGGVAGFEVTNRGKGWHPHLHALIDCRWLAVGVPEPQRGCTRKEIERRCRAAQDELAEVWGAYIQGSKASVWVERVKGGGGDGVRDTLAETLKYAVKPDDLLAARGLASDMIDMIDAGRMMTSFGHAHACARDFIGRGEEEPRKKLCNDCKAEASLYPSEIVNAMLAGRMEISRHVERKLREGDERRAAQRAGVSLEEWRRQVANGEAELYWDAD